MFYIRTREVTSDTSFPVRAERPADAAAIREVNEAAFGASLEADIVDKSRALSLPWISLVAEVAGEIVGHILFSPVTLGGHERVRLVGLAPMAVLPARQRQGIGTRLVHEGLSQCRSEGYDAVVVLGHPGYYPRFGFTPASRFGITSEYAVPDEVFMCLELRQDALRGVSGRVVYSEAFAGA